MLSPAARKVVLVTHVVASVGWLGAVGVFLTLAVASLASADATSVHALYLAMDLCGWYVIVPLCLASLASGVAAALGTAWGLVRHYWVLLKLAMTIPSTFLLLMHLHPLDRVLAGSGPGPRVLTIQLIVESLAALVVLMVATILSIYKPRGTTSFGSWRPPVQPP